MFAVAYLILLAAAASPLAITILRHRGEPSSPALARRIYRDLAYVAAAIVAIVVLETIFKIALENYWFTELGQQARFWFAFRLQATLFATVFILGGAFVGFNFWLACRPAPSIPPSAPWLAGLVLAAAFGFGATTLWTPLTAYLGRADRRDRPGVRQGPFLLPARPAPLREDRLAYRHPADRHDLRLGGQRLDHPAAPAAAVGASRPAPDGDQRVDGPGPKSGRRPRGFPPRPRRRRRAGCRRAWRWGRSTVSIVAWRDTWVAIA